MLKQNDLVSSEETMTLEQRRAFLKLPLAERRRMLSRQAENAAVQDISGARLVDFTEKFCPGSVCQSTIAGQVVYRDSNHMTSSFAQEFVPLLEQQMDSLVGEQQRN